MLFSEPHSLSKYLNNSRDVCKSAPLLIHQPQFKYYTAASLINNNGINGFMFTVTQISLDAKIFIKMIITVNERLNLSMAAYIRHFAVKGQNYDTVTSVKTPIFNVKKMAFQTEGET